MQYIRVIVTRETGESIYRKDLRARDAFSPLVTEVVRQFTNRGIFRDGDVLKVRVGPGYGTLPDPPLSIAGDKPDSASLEASFSFMPGESHRPNDPISFFWLEFRLVHSGLGYRHALPASALTYLRNNIAKALRQYGVMGQTEKCEFQFFFRDDEEGDLHRDEILDEADDEPLIDLIASEESQPSFEIRTLADCAKQGLLTPVHVCEAKDSPQAADPPAATIVVHRSALDAMRAVALRPVSVEQGGVLVGNIYRSGDEADGPRFLVEVTDHIEAESALSSVTELRYTFQTWQHQNAQLKQRFPNKRIIGWYHTHLVKMRYYSGDAQKTRIDTELFFSSDDQFMHGQFFRDPWYVAMVFDPQGNAAFFVWRGEEIGLQRDWHIIDPLGDKP